VPYTLVGEVMAHQDAAGPPVRENNRPSWRVNASASPPGTAAQTHRPGGNSSRTATPTAGCPIHRGWIRYESPSGGHVRVLRLGGHSGAAT